MNLTKKEQADVSEVYEIWLNSYLTGDVKTYDSYFDDRYRFIGSTSNEDFLNRNDTTRFFEVTADQLAGKVEIRNNRRTLEKFDDLIFITDLFDAYFLNGNNWEYYEKFRFTSILKKTNDDWRFVYQHFSTPDSKAQEGETIGTEQIAAENLMLREAVKRRTTELEQKNRELAIEAATERVRTQAMAMQHPDDLDKVNKEILNQLNLLQIPGLTGVTFYLVNENGWVNAWDFSSPGNMGNQNSYSLQFDFKKYEMMGEPFQILRQTDLNYFVADYPLEKLEKAVYELEEINPAVASVFREALAGGALNHQWTACARISNGLLGVDLVSLPSGDTKTIVLKMAAAFNQAYTRFLDLQKAEKQAKEAQIETALEKVRSRTMAMQKSEELLDLVKKIYSEIEPFGVSTTGITIALFREDENAIENWFADNLHSDLLQSYKVVGQKNKVFKQIWEDWKNKNPQRKVYLEGPDKKGYDNYILTETDYRQLPEELKEEIHSHKTVCFTFTYFKYGYFESVDLTIPAEENAKILLRFAKVFEQTYTRFLDLQKAEAQARESQIQLALERLRARTMAMQHSDELADASFVLDSQVRSLGIKTRGCAFNIYNDNESTEWFSSEAGTMPTYKTPRENIFLRYYEAGQSGKIMHIEEFEGETCINHYDYLCTLPVMGDALRKMKESGGSFPLRQIDHVIYFKYGYLLFITLEHVPEAHDIFKRFANVFEQTYTRFLDLQKAEAQAREAQIEAALEKVRSRSLAMHTPNELGEVVTVIVEKLTDLGVVLDANGVVLCTYFADSKDVLHWIVSPDFKMAGSYLLPWFDHPIFREAWESKESGDTYFSKAYSVEDKNSFFEYAFEHSDYRHFPEDFKQWVFQNDKHILSFAWQKNSAILIPSHTGVVPTEDEAAILKRFAKVFEQAYTRFLDLQRAETQAREAQIEAALERVRSKAMSMHSSEDLAATIGVFYRELEQFSITPRRCGVGLLQKNRLAELSTMNTMEQGNSIEIIGKLKMEGHWVLDGVYDNWILQKEFHPVLRGNEIKEYNRLLRPQVAFPEYPNDSAQFGYFFFFPEGGVYAWTPKEMKEDELNIYRRFTKVLSLTYKRYKDLKDAEANVLEAVRRASLDRVRAEIASMRTVDDLQRITPIIWHELTMLGIPFVRCGVFIIDESTEHIQVHLSSPDGSALGALDLPFNSSELTLNSVNHWRQGIIFKTHWNKQEFLNFMHSMIKLGQVSNQETYQGAAQPPESLHLHFVPFKQGMLYVGNTSPLEKEALELVKSLAESFSIAYARYEDFRQLELAKNQIEKTFTVLKAAQAQLIQAEKMASLGELTAGIAHEIQNPLNFVNNFSEISNELVDEMKEELAVGNMQSANEIVEDIKQNLQKINHHGKRAADIVKGMLQHSRTSSGQKEPTDINALADEYLRLAYHGLRAKDKSFNAKMNTDFDETIGKINIIPQDIGRVILNLITNAFYVVDEKKKLSNDGYDPVVSVSTKKMNNLISISVKDNGNGIPKHILDKIFQPFFTTKPTGQGTGLGLSLAYDIVKAHGGELKVETKEGEGSTFTILIPVEQ